jgi:phosphatidylinositol alpha-mannosyltransferase
MAFNELAKRRHDVQLLIAGSGVDNQKLHDYAEEEAIPRVKFLGYVTESEKLHLLHSADVFCSPALYGESFGVVLWRLWQLDAQLSPEITWAIKQL